jgi:formamidopyrimidine-DNA glycosylase
MPELPDLQVFSRNLTKALKGKKVTAVEVHNAKKLNVTHQELQDALVGKTLNKVERAGKELHIHFSGDQVLGMHLMLNGKLYLFKDKNEQKYTIVELLFDDNTGLVMADFQGIATPTLNPEENNVPDALSDDLDFKYLSAQLQKKKTAVKNILLDQHIIRGIGNAYADEILWDARISPFSISNKIPEDQVKHLLKSIKQILEDAEQQILKTHPDIIAGEVRDFMVVHNSKKKETPGGHIIHQKPIASRKTYYTDEQVEY